jgi:hypothetical protein
VTEYLAEDTLRFSRALPTDVVNMVDLCVLRGRLFGLARSGNRLLRELIESGGRLAVRKSFGLLRSSHPLAAHPILQSYVADGRMFCDDTTTKIYVASRLLGEIHVIHADTEEQQTVAIHDFRPIQLETVKGRGLSLGMPASAISLVGITPATWVSIVISRYENGDDHTLP